jgi:hypothetical protein
MRGLRNASAVAAPASTEPKEKCSPAPPALPQWTTRGRLVRTSSASCFACISAAQPTRLIDDHDLVGSLKAIATPGHTPATYPSSTPAMARSSPVTRSPRSGAPQSRATSSGAGRSQRSQHGASSSPCRALGACSTSTQRWSRPDTAGPAEANARLTGISAARRERQTVLLRDARRYLWPGQTRGRARDNFGRLTATRPAR